MRSCSILRRILRCALRLNLLRVKDTIAGVGAFDKSLGVVLECVRRRLGAAIRNLQLEPLLIDLEVGSGAFAVNAARHDLAGDAETLALRLAAHALQFLDRDVVALALLNTRKRQIGKRADNYSDCYSKSEISTNRRHELKSIPAAWAGQENRILTLYRWEQMSG